jgi:glycosyltransferase involved in cell wall biosynthesis
VLVYDDWDYFPGEQARDPFWHWVMRFRERVCVRAADAVISVSSSLRQLREEQGAKRTALVPNGVDLGLFRQAQQRIPHPPTLVYMGSLAHAWGADLPIAALPEIRRSVPEARYMVIGRGPDEARLRVMASELGLDGAVHFCGNQAYQDLPRFLAEADIGVATSRDTEFRRHACPLKIVEYMAAGLPVIGTQMGETQAIIEKAMAGEAVRFSPQAFAHAAVTLLSDRGKYDQYARNALAFAERHDWQHLLDDWLALVEQMA